MRDKRISLIPQWVSHSVFYQIFPDRFAKSNRSSKPSHLEPWNELPTTHGFKGGDLWGIIEKLDYLEDLGINAIYLNPIFASPSNHRYHTHDFFQVDPILGGNKALADLLDAAHSRGIRVILDGVFNHTGRSFYQFAHTLENGKHSPYIDWFYFNQSWLDTGAPINAYAICEHLMHDKKTSLDRHGYQAWWDLPALPKLNTNNSQVREFIWSVAEYWIEFGIDGWRLDVPSEIDDDLFWREFRNRVRAKNPEAYIVGEIWEDASRWLQGDQFDGVMNYLFTRACIGFFSGQNLNHEEIQKSSLKDVRPLSPIEFADQIQKIFGMYPFESTKAQLNLLGSHDTPRILSMFSGDKESLKMAYLCLMTSPGAPSIYYGDEVGMAGGQDPDCRRSFEWDELRWDQELRGFLKACIKIRRHETCLSRGLFKIAHADHQVVAYNRYLEDQKPEQCSDIMVVFNTSYESKSISLSFTHSHPIDDSSNFAINPFSGEEITLIDNKSFDVTLPPRTGQIWVPNKRQIKNHLKSSP